MIPQEIRALDRAHVWHPYEAMPAAQQCFVVESASGVRLRFAEPVYGMTSVVDAMSSWWSAVHGYAHPHLDAAIRDQLTRMSHVMFGGLTHEPAVTLATRLVRMSPEALQHVFLCDSGSVAVEIAVKMCLQYWRSLRRPEKTRLLTWRGGYHGDTFHPMSVCDPVGGMHSLWKGVLTEQVFVDIPPMGIDAEIDAGYVDALRTTIAIHANELAAVIVEPVVQGTGGMRFINPGYLQVLRDLTQEYGVLLIFDEIATGFGRTGALFAADHAGVSPDVMCVGKALTGGYMSMAAALCSTEVARGISRGEVPVLAHGPTFMGNPLACSVANASLDLVDAGQWRDDVPRIAGELRDGLAEARAMPAVADVRVQGAIGVVQLDHPIDIRSATEAAIREGVWVRPFRNLIYTMPPLISSPDDIAMITRGIVAAVRAA